MHVCTAYFKMRNGLPEWTHSADSTPNTFTTTCQHVICKFICSPLFSCATLDLCLHTKIQKKKPGLRMWICTNLMGLNWNIATIAWNGNFLDDIDAKRLRNMQLHDIRDTVIWDRNNTITRWNNYITGTQSTSTALILVLRCARCSWKFKA